MRERRLGRRLTKALDDSGLQWEIKNGKKHTLIHVEGRLIQKIGLSPMENRRRAPQTVKVVERELRKIKQELGR